METQAGRLLWVPRSSQGGQVPASRLRAGVSAALPGLRARLLTGGETSRYDLHLHPGLRRRTQISTL